MAKASFKAASVFIAMIVGFILAVILGFVDFSSVGDAAWFALPTPFKFGLSFKAGAIVPVLFLFLVSMLEFIGDTTGVAINAADRPATNTELTHGILCDGLEVLSRRYLTVRRMFLFQPEYRAYRSDWC